jgi:predicted ArsR family transcriptional regulator
MVAVERVEANEAPFEKTKFLIETYLKKQFQKKKQIYPSDAADALGLSYITVHQVFDALEREGKIQESR